MVYFLRTILIVMLIIFLVYLISSFTIMKKVDDDILEDLMDKKGLLDWDNGIKLPDRQQRKEILTQAIAKSKGIKHKKLATFIVKCKDFIRVLFGIFLGLFIYFAIKMIF